MKRSTIFSFCQYPNTISCVCVLFILLNAECRVSHSYFRGEVTALTMYLENFISPRRSDTRSADSMPWHCERTHRRIAAQRQLVNTRSQTSAGTILLGLHLSFPLKKFKIIRTSYYIRRKTILENKGHSVSPDQMLAVDTPTLCKLLCCGRQTAVQIGDLAHARITMNSRVLWSVQRIREYLYDISC